MEKQQLYRIVVLELLRSPVVAVLVWGAGHAMGFW